MTRVFVLNGPNLGRLGSREPEVYGHQDLSALRVMLASDPSAEGIEIDLRQTDDEGELIGITFRHTSVISGIASGVIAGFGFDSYVLALAAVRRAN